MAGDDPITLLREVADRVITMTITRVSAFCVSLASMGGSASKTV
jgi:hypothetical protein